MRLDNPDLDIVERYNVHCYRIKDLVYIGTPKCGSTFYTSLLLANGWVQTYFSDIDWQNDFVVAFIRDPYTRYVKGLVEDIFESESGEFEKIIERAASRFKKHILVMGPHTMPITTLLEGYVEKINWIAVSDSSHQTFLDLCATRGIVLVETDEVDPHHSDGHKQQVYLKFKELVGDVTALYQMFFDRDQKLYESAKNTVGLYPKK